MARTSDPTGARLEQTPRPWDHELPAHGGAGATGGRRASMACLGRTGQWGNSLMAYFALKAFSEVHGMAAEVPRWIGQDLFGWRDASVTGAHPTVLYDGISELCQDSHHPMVAASLAMDRERQLRPAGRRLVVVRDPDFFDRSMDLPATEVDLEGPYLLHTRHLSRHRDLLRRMVEPVLALRGCLEAGWSKLQSRGAVVIGVHIRRGDFDDKFSHQGFEFVAPMKWYRAWLDELWGRYERPVLFVASDSLPQVLPALARYDPITSRDLGVSLPAEFLRLDLPAAHLQRDAGFLPDWFMLTRCQALAISNSTFSFTAAMVNESASVFARPDPRANGLVPFDPWDSEPLLFLPTTRHLPLEVLRRLVMAQRGIGARATLSNVRRALRWYADVLLVRAIAARRYSGTAGLLREMLRPQFYLSACRRYDQAEPGPPTVSP